MPVEVGVHPRSEVRPPDLFDRLSAACQARFATVTADAVPLFSIETDDLYDLYLSNLRPEDRQHHTCQCCKLFLRRFGNLATIGSDGAIQPALWRAGDAPEPYAASVAAMERAVRRGAISGVFLSAERVWGAPEAGGWTHFSVTPNPRLVYRRAGLTAGQAMAAKKEDYKTLTHGLRDYDRATVAQALWLLETDALYRSEKVIGPARFLLALHDNLKRARNRNSVIWRAVGSAPVGFCAPRSSMISTLLDDIKSGLDFDAVKSRFAAKMHPLQYQRPQAPAAAGNIAAAEKLVADMGLAPALRRRWARLDEIQAVWRPPPPAAPSPAGLFSHLQPKGLTQPVYLSVPPQTITWEKFRRTVLPGALTIEMLMGAVMDFAGLVTAVDPDAPPILQWDRAEKRNPFSWYLWIGGSSPSQWGLQTGCWVRVSAVTLQPHLWDETAPITHQGHGVLMVLEGARDTRSPGLCLFPEILRSELHAARATIEAYLKAGKLEGREEASANGIIVGTKEANAPTIRVTSALGMASYRIDRWD